MQDVNETQKEHPNIDLIEYGMPLHCFSMRAELKIPATDISPAIPSAGRVRVSP